MFKKKERRKFVEHKIDSSVMKDSLEFDWDALYERAYGELGLQQTKRDQIITIYLAIFSFLIPFALSEEKFSWQVKGFIFMAAAIVGILFAFVIIRYRVYKEVYWLCCQTLTVLFGVQRDKIDKELIQQFFFETIQKKGKSFCVERDEKEMEFSKIKYVKKNIFSSETIHFFIHAFISAVISGLSVGLIFKIYLENRIWIAIIVGIIVFLMLSWSYFRECIKVYGVLADGYNDSFNFAFSKAWFLHLYREKGNNEIDREKQE